MQRVILSFLGAVILNLWLVAPAGATTINFDAMASTISLSGAPPAGTVLTNNLASLGIIFGRAGFSAGSAVISNATNTSSAPNGACGLDTAGNIVNACAGDQYFRFVDPSNGTTAATTNFLSFVVGDSGFDLDSWILNVYNSADVLLEARVISTLGNTLQTFNYAGIARVWIQNTTGTTAGYLLDDINFNAPTPSGTAAVLPEPGTFVLLGTGLGAIVAAVRRRRS